jgi:hypothetical protein
MAVAPPLLLLGLAHIGAFMSHSALVAYVAMVAAWALGMTALVTSGWQRRAMVWVCFRPIADIRRRCEWSADEQRKSLG